MQITVTTPEGKPLPGVNLEAVERPDGAILQAMVPLTDQRGQHTWKLDMPGRYTFTATATGYISQTKQVVVQPKSTVKLDFVLVPDGS